MDNNSLYQNVNYIRSDQYRDSRNLGARAQLHQRYSSNPHGWFSWVMDHLSLQPETYILECGCGPGWLWRNNLDKMPERCRITLTDLSPGMVSEAEEALAPTGLDFRFFDADITKLPFGDQEFDVVVANHMLYHVSDRSKAFAEVKRVLKTDGRFFAATIGEKHMLELHNLRIQLAPEQAASHRQESGEFSLENGRSQLGQFFSKIELNFYENRLLVTDANDVLDYLLSSSQARSEVNPQELKLVSQIVQNQIDEHSSFDITTASGLFRMDMGA